MTKSFLEVHWGEKSLLALYISVLSGLVVALQYDQAAPYYSTNSLDLLIPFGAFCRSLHFYSSQLFFLLSVLHLIAIIGDQSYKSLPLGKWAMLICTLPVTILLLFTGYILRGDATGESAGFIAENIALSLPVGGNLLNELLFYVSQGGLKRVYANHMIGLGILWGILAWDHVRRYRVNWHRNGWWLLGGIALCIGLDAPMEPGKLGEFRVLGPWFFVGLQELLRYLQPFWAGIVFPAILLLSLVFLQPRQDQSGRDHKTIIPACIVIWLASYLLLTTLGLLSVW